MPPGEAPLDQFRRWYGMKPVGLRTLVAINVVFYVVWLFVLLFRIGPVFEFVHDHIALHPIWPTPLFEFWQLVTYNFIHVEAGFFGLLHILFNMLWLYWLGMEFEEMHGPHALVAVYLIAGVFGGLFSVLVLNLLGSGTVDYLIHGASASVLGVMAAVATFYPDRRIGLLFIGVVPLKWVVIGFLILDVLIFSGSGTAVTAHIGGALGGFLFARAERSGLDLSSWASIFFPSRRRSRPRAARNGTFGRGGTLFGQQAPPPQPRRTTTLRRVTREEVADANVVVEMSTSEVDRILEKILEKGYDSLTAEEKRILDRASRQ